MYFQCFPSYPLNIYGLSNSDTGKKSMNGEVFPTSSGARDNLFFHTKHLLDN
jgi:hypothetical protein